MFITYSPSTRVFMVKNNLYWLSFLQHVSIFTHANFMLLNYFHRQLWVNKYLMGYVMSGHCCIECIRKKTNNKIADFHHSMVFFILLSLFFVLFGRGQMLVVDLVLFQRNEQILFLFSFIIFLPSCTTTDGEQQWCLAYKRFYGFWCSLSCDEIFR